MAKLDDLRELALDQHGFVTRAQARGLGVTDADLSKLTARGRITRPVRGVYRIPGTPATEADAYQLAVLWTGEPEACLSHETALDVWGVAESLPEKTHLTVPRNKRIRREGGVGYVVHYQDLDTRCRGWHEGLPVVCLSVALRQSLEYGVPSRTLRRAAEIGLQKNLITKTEHAMFIKALEERDAS